VSRRRPGSPWSALSDDSTLGDWTARRRRRAPDSA
jgi:hypothetical protein